MASQKKVRKLKPLEVYVGYVEVNRVTEAIVAGVKISKVRASLKANDQSVQEMIADEEFDADVTIDGPHPAHVGVVLEELLAEGATEHIMDILSAMSTHSYVHRP